MIDATFADEAVADPKRFYDERYAQGYMQDFSDLYEACRLFTVRSVLEMLTRDGLTPRDVLDYGCGEGRYLTVWRQFFAEASLTGCDISDRALQIASQLSPDATLVPMADERVDLKDASFDLITSIEVLEHVRNADAAVAELGRLLRPRGILVLTTPSANPYSVEWCINRLRGGLLPSFDGYGRFATDEPGHLRRLSDRQLLPLLRRHGLEPMRVFHRAHLFTPLSVRLGARLRRAPKRLWVELALLDWHLLRWLPNGATVLVIAQRAG